MESKVAPIINKYWVEDAFGGKADIRSSCPLLTQSGHWISWIECFFPKEWPDGPGRRSAAKVPMRDEARPYRDSVAFDQRALINCTPLKPLPLYQASQMAISARPRPSPAAAAKA
jgi:hypothetical protein